MFPLNSLLLLQPFFSSFSFGFSPPRGPCRFHSSTTALSTAPSPFLICVVCPSLYFFRFVIFPGYHLVRRDRSKHRLMKFVNGPTPTLERGRAKHKIGNITLSVILLKNLYKNNKFATNNGPTLFGWYIFLDLLSSSSSSPYFQVSWRNPHDPRCGSVFGGFTSFSHIQSRF